MAICKFCGAESGDTKFCQNCGAKLEVEPQPIQPQVQQPIIEQPMLQQQPDNSFHSYQPSHYAAGSATGLLTGNIILVVFSCLFCCCVLGISVISLILGIVGIVYASKVKTSQNAEEEAHNRSVSRICMIIGYALYVVMILFLIIGATLAYGSLDAAVEAIQSAYESVSEELEESLSMISRLL